MRGKVVPLHVINVCGKVKVYLHSFLTSALWKCEYSTLQRRKYKDVF